MNKNKVKLQEQGIRDIYYYASTPDRSRTAVCLLVDGNKDVLARGISICSPQDQYVKRRGRAIACGRALKALKHSESSLPIHPRDFRYGSNLGLRNGFDTKATWLPRLKIVEEAIVDKLN